MGKAIRIVDKTVIKWDGEYRLDGCRLSCCAIAEISGIQSINDPFTSLVSLACNDVYDEDAGRSAPIVLFSSTNDHLAGDELMDFIHKEKLGEVTFSKGVKNWADTGNTVYLYTWIVDQKAWEKYSAKIIEELEDF